jgi:hypothetical protein
MKTKTTEQYRDTLYFLEEESHFMRNIQTSLAYRSDRNSTNMTTEW